MLKLQGVRDYICQALVIGGFYRNYLEFLGATISYKLGVLFMLVCRGERLGAPP